MLILLFQLSLKFERLTEYDIHSRFDEKLSTYASNILHVECTARKEKFAVLQTKISLARREEENSCKFLDSVNHLFQISKFSSRFKIAALSNINTVSKKVALPFKLIIYLYDNMNPLVWSFCNQNCGCEAKTVKEDR